MRATRVRTPRIAVRIQPALRVALDNYGQKTGIGDLSAVVRFACASLLRNDGALVNEQATGTDGRRVK